MGKKRNCGSSDSVDAVNDDLGSEELYDQDGTTSVEGDETQSTDDGAVEIPDEIQSNNMDETGEVTESADGLPYAPSGDLMDPQYYGDEPNGDGAETNGDEPNGDGAETSSVEEDEVYLLYENMTGNAMPIDTDHTKVVKDAWAMKRPGKFYPGFETALTELTKDL